MSDSYIDALEVDEYTRYFLRQVISLILASPLVDIEALRQRVQNAAANVEREIVARGLQRSNLRIISSDTGDVY